MDKLNRLNILEIFGSVLKLKNDSSIETNLENIFQYYILTDLMKDEIIDLLNYHITKMEGFIKENDLLINIDDIHMVDKDLKKSILEFVKLHTRFTEFIEMPGNKEKYKDLFYKFYI